MDENKKKRPDMALYQPKKTRSGAGSGNQSAGGDGEPSHSGGASREGSGESNYDGGLRITRTYVNSKFQDNDEIVVTHSSHQRQSRGKRHQQSARAYTDVAEIHPEAGSARSAGRPTLQSRGPSRHNATPATTSLMHHNDYYDDYADPGPAEYYQDYHEYYYEYDEYEYDPYQYDAEYEAQYGGYETHGDPRLAGSRRPYATAAQNTAPYRGRNQRERPATRGMQRTSHVREERVQDRTVPDKHSYAYARSASDYRPGASVRSEQRHLVEFDDEPIRRPGPDSNRRPEREQREPSGRKEPRTAADTHHDAHARSEPPQLQSRASSERESTQPGPAKQDGTDRQKAKRNERDRGERERGERERERDRGDRMERGERDREGARNKPHPRDGDAEFRRGHGGEKNDRVPPQVQGQSQPPRTEPVKEPVRLPTQSQLSSMTGSTKGGLIVLPKEIDMASLKISPDALSERNDRAHTHRTRDHVHGDSQFAFGSHSNATPPAGRFPPSSSSKPVSVVRPNIVRGGGRSGWTTSGSASASNSASTSRHFNEYEYDYDASRTGSNAPPTASRTEHERRSPSPPSQSIGSWADIIMMDEEDRRKRSDPTPSQQHAPAPREHDASWTPAGAAWAAPPAQMPLAGPYAPQPQTQAPGFNRQFQPSTSPYGPPAVFPQPAYSPAAPEVKSRSAQLLDEAVSIEREICEMIEAVRAHEGSPLLNDTFVNELHALRTKVQATLEQVILTDGEFCNNLNIEAKLWTAAYYQVIEPLRELAKDASPSSSSAPMGSNASRAIAARSRAVVLEVCDGGLRFFESLLQRVESTHSLRFDDFGDPSKSAPRPRDRPMKLALYSAQKLMLFNGDLCRYRELLNEGGQPSGNFGKARTWYVKAQQLAPKNGRPYNQLAVLAILTKRKLDALYYNVRALASSNPFLSARDCLKGLFDEVRKKTDAVLAQRAAEKRDRETRRTAALDRRRRAAAACADSNTCVSARREIWVHADGTRSERLLNEDQAESDDDNDDTAERPACAESLSDELKQLSSIELNKRFNMSFLHVHGKLFTKIGMDTFPEAASQTLHEFTALLERSPLPLGSQRLLQLVLINIFAVENVLAVSNTQPQAAMHAQPHSGRRSYQNANDSANKPAITRSSIVEDAVLLGLDTFAIMCKRIVALLAEFNLSDAPSPSASRTQRSSVAAGDREKLQDAGEPPRRTSSVSIVGLFSEDVRQLLPAVKVWCDWMMVRPMLWNPAPLPRDPLLGPDVDVWQAVCDLVNALDKYVRQHCGALLAGTGRASRPAIASGVKLERWHDELVSRVRASPHDVMVVLPEDNFVAGFKFLEACEPDTAFVDPQAADHYDAEVIMDVLRASKLKDFAEYLLGLEPVPFLDIDVINETYVNVAPKHAHSEVTMPRAQIADALLPDALREQQRPNADAAVRMPWASLPDAASGADAQRLNELMERRNQLAQSSATIEQANTQLQRVIDANTQAGAAADQRLTIRVEMSIFPAFLLADTNCYIDHLELVKRLVATQKYTVLLPLIVLSELDGLSRGAAPARNWLYSVSVSRARRLTKSVARATDSSADRTATARRRGTSTELADTSDDDVDADAAAGSHAEYVRERARIAVAYLEDEINERCNSKLQPVTQKGERLNDIRFRNEEILVKNMKNDELILETCLYRINEKAQDYRERGGPLSLFRDIVLLTNDRNLRLRAISKNVPAKDIMSFVKWARVPESVKPV